MISKKVVEENSKGRHVILSLCLDEMSLRKFIVFSNGEYHGNVNLGDGMESDEEATHALAIMVVCVNSSWKLPLAHFFTKGILAQDLANLVRMAIVYINETGAVLTNITLDNAATNISMLNMLGANVSDHTQLKSSTDEKNCLGIPIVVLLDPCHILKLVRGALHDCRQMYSTFASPALWSHITALQELQSAEGLKLGNKLTETHVTYSRQKMKVYLAAQVLSNSVADALEYCQNKSMSEKFEDTAGTCLYLRTFNVLFDRMNSRRCFESAANGSKSPISKRVIEEVKVDFKKAEAYILSLMHADPDIVVEHATKKRKAVSTLVVEGSRKKGFLGFLINMKSIIQLYELYIQTNYLQYLCTYKTSQDHVELLFCSVRGSLGKNNNPTVLEFSRALRMIILGASHSSRFSNCTLQDDTVMQILPTKLEDALEVCRSVYMSEDECEDWITQYISSSSLLSEYKQDIIVYISGFVQKSLLKKEHCLECKVLISNQKTLQSSEILDIKNRGPLIIPCSEFVKVCTVAFCVFEGRVKEPHLLTEKNLVQRLVLKTKMIVHSKYPNILSFLGNHAMSLTSNHSSIMIGKIASLLLTILMHHHCKIINNKETKVRQMYSKLILFKNQ